MRAVWIGALVVGVLDITEVIVFYRFRGVLPARVLQGVAAGLLGRDAARAGGTNTAALGLAIHFFIAFVVVLVYWLASRKIAFLREHGVIAGAIYGVLVYFVMNFLVVPMSAIGAAPKLSWPTLNVFLAHIFCVGIPASIVGIDLIPASIKLMVPSIKLVPREYQIDDTGVLI